MNERAGRETLLNWFQATELYQTQRGPMFTGPAPFDADKQNPADMERFYKVPWCISHPEAKKDRVYQVLGIDSFANQMILRGQSIGLLVREMCEGDIT